MGIVKTTDALSLLPRNTSPDVPPNTASTNFKGNIYQPPVTQGQTAQQALPRAVQVVQIRTQVQV